MEPRWIERQTPLEPAGLIALGAVVDALHARLADAPDEALARLRGVAIADGWIVVGPNDALPWVDGLTYVARDPEAPGLYVPTYLALEPPAALVERALRRRLGEPPWVLFGAPLRAVPLAAARPLDRGALARSREALAGARRRAT